LHTALQPPFEQAAVAFVGAVHGLSQRPQWVRFVRTSTHAPVHSIAGETHSVSQVPAAHVGRALAAPGQTLPQLPQFEVSVAVTTHEPLHWVVPLVQPFAQAPSAQTVLVAQAVVHVPQCAASVWRFTQALPQGE
jgi:hypothetical protein